MALSARATRRESRNELSSLSSPFLPPTRGIGLLNRHGNAAPPRRGIPEQHPEQSKSNTIALPPLPEASLPGVPATDTAQLPPPSLSPAPPSHHAVVPSTPGVTTAAPQAVPEPARIISASADSSSAWVVGANMLLRPSSPVNWAPEAWGGASEFLSEDSNALRVDVDRVDKSSWHAQVNWPNLRLVDGQTYVLSFLARAGQSRTLGVNLELDRTPWTSVGLVAHANLGVEWRRYQFPVTVRDLASGEGRLSFVVGQSVGAIWLSDVALLPLQPLQPRFVLRQQTVQPAEVFTEARLGVKIGS